MMKGEGGRMPRTIVYRARVGAFVHTLQVRTSQLKKELSRLSNLGAIICQVF